MARNNQGPKKPKLGERTEVRTFAQKADSAAAFPLSSKWSLEPQKPQGPHRTHSPWSPHRTCRPSGHTEYYYGDDLLVLYLNTELVLLVILKNFTMGFWFAVCEDGFKSGHTERISFHVI